MVRDVIGREWQLGTVRLTTTFPNDLIFRTSVLTTSPPASDDSPRVWIHGTILRGVDRALLARSHLAGPGTSPRSADHDKSADYAAQVQADLRALGLRSHLDNSADRVQNRIRLAAEDRIPWTLVVGPRDEENDTVSVRMRHPQRPWLCPTEQFVRALHEESTTRGTIRSPPNSSPRPLKNHLESCRPPVPRVKFPRSDVLSRLNPSVPY